MESVDLTVYSYIVARQRLSKQFPMVTKNGFRCRFLCGTCRNKGKEAIGFFHNFLVIMHLDNFNLIFVLYVISDLTTKILILIQPE
jgi:hypothetical protein